MTSRLRRRRIVDDAVDACVYWREERIAGREAYRAWTVSCSGDAALAFGTYESALDREERAATVYAGLLRRVGDLMPAEQHRLRDLCRFLEASEPRLIAFHEYANEDRTGVSVVHVHADAAPMEFLLGVVRDIVRPMHLGGFTQPRP